MPEVSYDLQDCLDFILFDNLRFKTLYNKAIFNVQSKG